MKIIKVPINRLLLVFLNLLFILIWFYSLKIKTQNIYYFQERLLFSSYFYQYLSLLMLLYNALPIFISIFKNQYFGQCNISSVCYRRYYNKCTVKESTSQIKIWTQRTTPSSRVPILISNIPSKDSFTITTEKMWEFIIVSCLFKSKKIGMFYMLN